MDRADFVVGKPRRQKNYTMGEDNRKITEPRRECPGCGGSGQISYFQGESRFLLTTEECPECLGTGFLDDTPESEDDTPNV